MGRRVIVLSFAILLSVMSSSGLEPASHQSRPPEPAGDGSFQLVASGQVVSLPKAPVVYQRHSVTRTGDGDLMLEPDEDVEVQVVVRNEGDADASSVWCWLKSEDVAEITRDYQKFVMVRAGAEVSCLFSFRTRSDYHKDRIVMFLKNVWTDPNGDYITYYAFEIPLAPQPGARTISFSGYEWEVKESKEPVGPGPNLFSSREDDVRVDADGQLHLRIVQRDGKWHCSEVTNTTSLGYGKYIFHIASPIDEFDVSAVLGLFTYDENAPEYHCREIDMEFSRWGDAEDNNAQYVVQPYDLPDHTHRFNMRPGDYSTHTFEWSKDSVKFQSSYESLAEGRIVESWVYPEGDDTAENDTPPAGDEKVHINFWLCGDKLSEGQEAEVVIKRFEFVPMSIPGDADKDGVVGVADLVIVGSHFGESPPSDPRADVNGDGKVDILDLIIIAGHFGETATGSPAKDIWNIERSQLLVLQEVRSAIGEIPGSRSMKVVELLDHLIASAIDKPILLQNYPNPCNPDTWIPYQLSKASKVSIAIHDISGHLIRRLDLGFRQRGFYLGKDKAAYWDGRNEAGEYVAGGIYFYTIKAGEFVQTRKLTVLR